MNWNDVPDLWKTCFEVAWESFREGARPIGAVVVNGKNEIVTTGKSCVFQETPDSVIAHNELAHAEMNALLKVDNRVHKEVADYTLYSTLEPCPLCFSAFYMSGIRNLKYAANDKYGGSTNLQGTTPYLSKKSITVVGPHSHLEQLAIMLTVYYDLVSKFEKGNPVHDLMFEDYPQAVRVAYEWAEEGKLENALAFSIEEVYQTMLEEMSTYTRDRAFGVIMKDDHILMVQETWNGRTNWTLPGGGVEEGETLEEAVVREVMEETNVSVKVDRFLFSHPYSHGESNGYLVSILDDSQVKLGIDPEHPAHDQALEDIKWWPVEEVKDDAQVAKVLEALSTNKI